MSTHDYYVGHNHLGLVVTHRFNVGCYGVGDFSVCMTHADHTGRYVDAIRKLMTLNRYTGHSIDVIECDMDRLIEIGLPFSLHANIFTASIIFSSAGHMMDYRLTASGMRAA